jgi:hypothetical protein
MSTKLYDVVAITGERPDGQGGTKPVYLNCGFIGEKDGKKFMKINCMPVGIGLRQRVVRANCH